MSSKEQIWKIKGPKELEKFVDNVIMKADSPVLETFKYLKLMNDMKIDILKEEITDLKQEIKRLEKNVQM